MLFNSYVFLFGFLPATLAAFYALNVFNRQLAVAWLLVASLVFYAYWNSAHLWLLLASIAFNYGAGRAILLLRKERLVLARAVAATSIACNLLLLGYFKYSGFLVANVTALLGSTPIAWNVVLPIGISFYTFTQITFLVDALRGRVGYLGVLEYALFVSHFPHLIAGPILHHSEMIRQFIGRAAFSRRNIAVGVAVFSVGLAKKVLVADSLAPHADAIFDATQPVQLIDAWVGVCAYALQIYFDFSGYSDMAIGLSKMMNIDLPLNFYSPYKATSIVEFWRRWHMTLSRFLRDYVYIPLGGNRSGAGRYPNILITMILGGLWHGAAWTYVVWGALHGVFLLINHGFRKMSGRTEPRSRLTALGSWALTFTAVTVAWVFFRATSLEGALRIVSGLIGLNGLVSERSAPALGLSDWSFAREWIAIGAIANFHIVPASATVVVGLAIALLLPNTQQIFRLPFAPPSPEVALREPRLVTVARLPALRWRPTFGWALVCGLLYAASIVWMSGTTRFLYFQF